MVRKLEKIEKEMGYCDTKLEKERRLRTQFEFLSAEIEALERFLKLYESSDLSLHELPFRAIAQQIAVERSRSEKPGRAFQRGCESFVSAGIFQMFREDRKILQREREELRGKLTAFSGFGTKRDVLVAERDRALLSLAPAYSSRMRKLNGELKKIETEWNSLTEDSLNLDEAVFYLSRNVDYVKSARSFLIASKGGFDIENWLDSGYTTDLFRHSNIARAKEMLDGACRNQKLARNELCCMIHVDVPLEGFEPILSEFLASLFEDIFLEGRLANSILLVESALGTSDKYLRFVRQKRETLHSKLDHAEKSRIQLFQRLGGEHRGRVSAR